MRRLWTSRKKSSEQNNNKKLLSQEKSETAAFCLLKSGSLISAQSIFELQSVD